MTTIEFKEASSDERRTIYGNSELLANKKEISFIKLKAGKAIGGCVHSCDEYFIVWEGQVKVITKSLGQKYTHTYTQGQGGIFPRGVAHLMIGDSDCLISEWGVSELEKKENKKNEDLLNLMRAING